MTGNDRVSTQEPRTSTWLMTFADISALLLAFFVMLFSMSTLSPQKWEKVIAKVSVNDPQKDKRRPPPVSSDSVPKVDVPPALPLGYLSQVMAEKLKADEILSRALIHRLDKLVIVSLPSDILFRPGKAALTESARDALFRLSSAIAPVGNQIDVYGHAMPVAAADAPLSPWQLSLARAVSVASELERIGYQRKVTMLGLGDSRSRHLSADLPEHRRHELARRVDLVIHPTEGER